MWTVRLLAVSRARLLWCRGRSRREEFVVLFLFLALAQILVPALALALVSAPAPALVLALALALGVVPMVLALVSLVVMTWVLCLSFEQVQMVSYLAVNSKALLSLLLVDLSSLAAYSILASKTPVHPHQVVGSAPSVALKPELVLKPESVLKLVLVLELKLWHFEAILADCFSGSWVLVAVLEPAFVCVLLDTASHVLAPPLAVAQALLS